MSAQIAGPDNRSFVTALGTRVTGNRSRLNESRLIKHAGRIQRIRPTFLQNPPFRYLTSCTCVVTSARNTRHGQSTAIKRVPADQARWPDPTDPAYFFAEPAVPIFDIVHLRGHFRSEHASRAIDRD